MSRVKDGRSILRCKRKGVKSESLSCGLTTHLHVVGNFGSRGRAPARIFYSLSLSSLLPPSHPIRVSLEGGARMFRGAGRKRILKQGGNCLSFSRAEIFLPSNFLRERDVAEKEKKRDTPSSDASPDALYWLR